MRPRRSIVLARLAWRRDLWGQGWRVGTVRWWRNEMMMMMRWSRGGLKIHAVSTIQSIQRNDPKPFKRHFPVNCGPMWGLRKPTPARTRPEAASSWRGF